MVNPRIAECCDRVLAADLLFTSAGGIDVSLLMLLVLLLVIFSLPTWPYSAGWGYYPSGGLGILLLILLILLLVRRPV